jgi:hypothetical protein
VKLHTQVWNFIPRCETSYPGVKLHTQVWNFIPRCETSYPGAKPERNQPQYFKDSFLYQNQQRAVEDNVQSKSGKCVALMALPMTTIVSWRCLLARTHRCQSRWPLHIYRKSNIRVKCVPFNMYAFYGFLVPFNRKICLSCCFLLPSHLKIVYFMAS